MDHASLQDEYAAHLRGKERRVRALLAAHGLEARFAGIEPCPLERGYRTQASFRAARDAAEAALVGVDPRLGRVPLADSLWVLPEPARPIALRVEEHVRRAGLLTTVTGFDLRLEHGSLRAHVSLSAPRDCPVRLDALCAGLMEEMPGLHGVSVAAQGIELGSAYLGNVLLGRTVLAHYLAFFQTNAPVTPLLCAEVQRPLDRPRTVVDLYCGVGMHSILAAERDTRVRGADSNRWAIESAGRNVALHALADARYDRVTAERWAADERFDRPDAVVVNPSRFGCGEGVPRAVAGWRPARVCLVSCSVDSHVRDMLAFAAAGCRPEAVRCFDMFPFSDYLECVTHFSPAGP